MREQRALRCASEWAREGQPAVGRGGKAGDAGDDGHETSLLGDGQEGWERLVCGGGSRCRWSVWWSCSAQRRAGSATSLDGMEWIAVEIMGSGVAWAEGPGNMH